MCDTLVAVGDATADGSVILAKNSDRQPNEAHVLLHLPRAQHQPGSKVHCTYIEIPQVPETFEVLLSKPFWIWGAEMGANEHGVAIANEAVFTKEPYDKNGGLIGMDLLRLGLERATTARQALDVIVDLLDTYGQGGNCGFHHPEYYHNAFAIADPHQAWVLQTAGKYWAARQVHSVCTISNGLTMGSEWDLASTGLVEHAVEKGWCNSSQDFDFTRCYSDFLYTTFSASRARQQRSAHLMEAQQGQITTEVMMAALRDHGPGTSRDHWHPGKGWLMDTLCVHAGFGPTRPSQSTGAMVAHLRADLPTYWLTGTSGTCTSIFKPVYLSGAGLPDMGPVPTGTYDPHSLWWSHERLHRAVLRDYSHRLPRYAGERDALETAFLQEAASLYEQHRSSAGAERARPLASHTRSCFERSWQATERWFEAVASAPAQQHLPFWFSRAWDSFDRQAGFGSGDGSAGNRHTVEPGSG
jgi:secernin